MLPRRLWSSVLHAFLAKSRIFRGPKARIMKSKALQVYAIVVCVIAVITFIISLSNVVSSLIDKQNPMHASWNKSDTYSSFERYKLESMKTVTKDQVYVPSDEELRSMYEEAKANMLAETNHRITRSLTVSSLVMGIAIVLFLLHWRLNKKMSVET